MKNEAVHWIPKDFMNLAANEACLRLQNVQQIRSMAVKYWFFLGRDVLKHLSGSRLHYMVKPHGQLVLVSSTPHSASTPSLSTS
jgi:hypothetical protein